MFTGALGVEPTVMAHWEKVLRAAPRNVLLLKKDAAVVGALEAELKQSVGGVKELIFDFSGVEYISSAGLRVLLAAQKVMNRQGSMKLIGVNDDVMEVFEMTGFADILTIE